MAGFPWVNILFLVLFTLAHIASSGLTNSHDFSKWPKPPCEMYYPLDHLSKSNCPDITAYICGTDGHTYQNECYLCLAQWEHGQHIKFRKHGKCKNG